VDCRPFTGDILTNMQEHGPQEAGLDNSCGIYTFLVIHGYSPWSNKEMTKIKND
jgi:hypothetical protein